MLFVAIGVDLLIVVCVYDYFTFGHALSDFVPRQNTVLIQYVHLFYSYAGHEAP